MINMYSQCLLTNRDLQGFAMHDSILDSFLELARADLVHIQVIQFLKRETSAVGDHEKQPGRDEQTHAAKVEADLATKISTVRLGVDSVRSMSVQCGKGKGGQDVLTGKG
jgi:hypothetical protein